MTHYVFTSNYADAHAWVKSHPDVEPAEDGGYVHGPSGVRVAPMSPKTYTQVVSLVGTFQEYQLEYPADPANWRTMDKILAELTIRNQIGLLERKPLL